MQLSRSLSSKKQPHPNMGAAISLPAARSGIRFPAGAGHAGLSVPFLLQNNGNSVMMIPISPFVYRMFFFFGKILKIVFSLFILYTQM